MNAADTIEWLLAGDPSIRWQVMCDLQGKSAATVARERARVAGEGWGSRLLAKQGKDGRWAGGKGDIGLYNPKWTSTTYTMLLLRDFGLDPRSPQARKACWLLLEHGLTPDGSVGYGTWAEWTRSGETCVTGMVLSVLSYFRYPDRRLDLIAKNLLDVQMDDGGWNCRKPRGATHSSVHTTISALEGLRFHELHRGRSNRAVKAAQRRGREFLLAHRLFRSHRTGKVIRPEFLRFAFPPRWHYDVLRALDYFRWVGAPRDKRLADGIEAVRAAQGADGRWPLQQVYRAKTWFDMERQGAPSRWNTLRALRVLRWWERS